MIDDVAHEDELLQDPFFHVEFQRGKVFRIRTVCAAHPLEVKDAFELLHPPPQD
jgi:hypothetical protein